MIRSRCLAGALALSLGASPAPAVPTGTAPPVTDVTGKTVTINGAQTTVDAALCGAVRAKPALRIVATRGQWPINTTGGASNTRFEASYVTFMGDTDAFDLRLAFTDTVALQGGEGTTNLADYTLYAAFYGFTGTSSASGTQKLFFGGTLNPIHQVGSRLLISDPSGIQASAGQSFQPRVGALLTSTNSTALLPVGGRSQAGTGADRMVEGPASQGTQVYGTGGIATPTGGAPATGYGFSPVAVLGYPVRPMASLYLWGDSIAWGQGDTNDGNGNSGALERGTWQARGGGTMPLAYVNVSRSGDYLSGAQPSQSQARWALVPYATHIVFGLGNNDIANGQTLAQMQANALALWRLAKRQGLYVSQVTLTPRTTSTDSWATPANQAVAAGYEGSGYTGTGSAPYTGLRGAFNAWVKAQVGQVDAVSGLKPLDAVLDFDAVYRDPANPDRWLTNGTAGYPTADGTHPTPALAILGGNAVRPVFAAYSAQPAGCF